LVYNSVSANSNGGTELLCREMERRVGPEILDQFQVFPSRVHAPLDPTKWRILWEHDLPGDPEAKHLLHGGWTKWHRIVMVSAWQKEGFLRSYEGLPPSKVITIQNAINPIDATARKPYVPGEPIRLIYTSTPHRGLEILAPVFAHLSEEFPEVELDVFSSFGIYGWPQEDERFKAVFDQLRAHPKVRYHGAQPNDVVRKTLVDAHILAYPSIWPETSCLCLIEAMSAGVTCVHPDFAALPETAANWTHMYQWHEDPSHHAQRFYNVLRQTVIDLKANPQAFFNRNLGQIMYTNMFYNWDDRQRTWAGVLNSIVAADEPREIQDEVMVYTSK
jgi:glycosyltransferase involved in cell wall biosynthesis